MTHMTLQAVRQLIANDSYAITFQSVEQYRGTLLRHFDSLIEVPVAAPAEEQRAAFEAWHHRHFGVAAHRAQAKHGGNQPGLEYWSDYTNNSWAGWQAAIAAQSQGAQAAPAKVNESREFDRHFPPATTDMDCDEYDQLVELRGKQWQAWLARAALAAKAEALALDESELRERLAKAILADLTPGRTDRLPIERVTSNAAIRRAAEIVRGQVAPTVRAEAPAAQQAAALGALDDGEMTRLRRLMKALGHPDAFEQPDRDVRGILFTLLGEAAGRIERAAAPSSPGTPEAPKGGAQ